MARSHGRFRVALSSFRPASVGVAALILGAFVVACDGRNNTPNTPTPTPTNSAPTTGTMAVTPGAAGLIGWTNFAFSVSGVTDADSDPITYSWDFGDGSAVAAGSTATRTYTAVGNYVVTVTATDGRSAAIVAAQRSVTVRNLTGVWGGRLNCSACAVTSLDVTFNITQTGTSFSGSCTLSSGAGGALTAFLPDNHTIVNLLGSCGGGSVDALFNASTDRLSLIWKSDYIGTLTR
ncbi:MAG: PKD domain-containing protein [Acidobacteriota bacterium]